MCAAHSIIHETSAPYTPQQNGLAERMNRTLVEMARFMIYHMEVEREWWGKAVTTAAYVLNSVPKTARPNASPYEVM